MSASGIAMWVVVAVIVVAVWVFRLVRRTRDPRGAWQEGEVFAVRVRVDPDARWRGDDEPMSVLPLVRLSTGPTREGAWLSLSAVPRSIRRQVFSMGGIVSEYDPNFRIADAGERRSAVEQAKSGGYEFRLAQPVPVAFAVSSGGRVEVRF